MSVNLLSLKPAKILIRSTNWIGDAIMTTPAVRTIRRNFPTAHITLLALPWVADIFAASPHLDSIFLYHKNGEHQGLKGRARLIRQLSQQKFDLTILLQNAFEAAFITTLAGISARAGYTTDGRTMFLTHRAKLDKETKRKHQVYYYQEMLKKLGLQPGSDQLFLEIPAAVNTWADDFIKNLQKGRGNKQYLVGLNPGASYGPAKRWPAEKYGELAAGIAEGTNSRIVIFGTEDDKDAASVIQRSAPEHIVDLTGKTSLSEAMALIKQCNVFITNDSGLMHVAAALQTPLVAIFGSTNPITTGPFSPKSIIIRKEIDCSPCMATHCKADFKCMQEITSNEVYSAATKMLTQNQV